MWVIKCNKMGPFNQTVHMWDYESLDDRLARRKLLLATRVW